MNRGWGEGKGSDEKQDILPNFFSSFFWLRCNQMDKLNDYLFIKTYLFINNIFIYFICRLLDIVNFVFKIY